MVPTHVTPRNDVVGHALGDAEFRVRWEYLIVALPVFPPARQAYQCGSRIAPRLWTPPRRPGRGGTRRTGQYGLRT